MRRKRLIYNTALLTISSLVMSCIGMFFQVWLANRIGTSGIGLYQLTLSVTMLFTTFAVSGVRFASTRLASEELGLGERGNVSSAMRHCLLYAMFFGSAAAIILRCTAAFLGDVCIGDPRTVLSLRIAAYSMPCIAVCSAVSGYFTACGRVWKAALIHFIEQIAGIIAVAILLGKAPIGDVEKSCAAVTAGRLIGDILSLLLMLRAYVKDRQIYRTDGASLPMTGKLLRTALPLAVSAYARSALSALQHLLVPRGLKASGFSADEALSGYGTVHGMVLPIILFPSCIMSSVAELIVPELTRDQVQRNESSIRKSVSTLMKLSVAFSFAVAVFLMIFADKLGLLIYNSLDAGYYIRILAPLVPVMYVDMSVDGCLKGLGEQSMCMLINVLDALTGLILVWQLVPRYALKAYIAIIYITEILNFVLSSIRLHRTVYG